MNSKIACKATRECVACGSNWRDYCNNISWLLESSCFCPKCMKWNQHTQLYSYGRTF